MLPCRVKCGIPSFVSPNVSIDISPGGSLPPHTAATISNTGVQWCRYVVLASDCHIEDRLLVSRHELRNEASAVLPHLLGLLSFSWLLTWGCLTFASLSCTNAPHHTLETIPLGRIGPMLDLRAGWRMRSLNLVQHRSTLFEFRNRSGVPGKLARTLNSHFTETRFSISKEYVFEAFESHNGCNLEACCPLLPNLWGRSSWNKDLTLTGVETWVYRKFNHLPIPMMENSISCFTLSQLVIQEQIQGGLQPNILLWRSVILRNPHKSLLLMMTEKAVNRFWKSKIWGGWVPGSNRTMEQVSPERSSAETFRNLNLSAQRHPRKFRVSALCNTVSAWKFWCISGCITANSLHLGFTSALRLLSDIIDLPMWARWRLTYD